MWNWLRNPRNLAVITVVLSVIGFMWTKLAPSPEKPPVPQSTPPININIDAKQTNTQTIYPSSAPPAPPISTEILHASDKKTGTALQQSFPIRRQLARGVPIEVMTDFWLELVGYEGSDGKITAYLRSTSWKNKPLSFKVGGLPFDFSHSGNAYQLVVESMNDERVIVYIAAESRPN